MKAVMISVQPKWCQLIASGKKTIEVRKTKPNLQTPFKCYIYCTTAIKKANTLWGSRLRGKYYYCDDRSHNLFDISLNKAVIGEFICDIIDKHIYDNNFENNSAQYPITNDELNKMYLSYHDFEKYGKEKPLYAWHITDLKIYDNPKELSEFERPLDCVITRTFNIADLPIKIENWKALSKSPQSWCYAEELLCLIEN